MSGYMVEIHHQSKFKVKKLPMPILIDITNAEKFKKILILKHVIGKSLKNFDFWTLK